LGGWAARPIDNHGHRLTNNTTPKIQIWPIHGKRPKTPILE
jgi:hypothetical protein